MSDDLQVFILRRRRVMEDEAKAVRQGNRLVRTVVAVDFIQFVVAVAPRFLQEVAAVRCCINKHVFRLRRNAAVDGRLEVFILFFIFVKREVVQEEDELLAANVTEPFHELLQIVELAALDLDEAQALFMIAADQGFDSRRLARPAGTRQEDVIGRPVSQESRRIGQELFFLGRIADEVIPGEMGKFSMPTRSPASPMRKAMNCASLPRPYTA